MKTLMRCDTCDIVYECDTWGEAHSDARKHRLETGHHAEVEDVA